MEPVRKLQTATHFKKVKKTGDDKDYFEPCSPGMRGSIEMDVMKVDPTSITTPDVSIEDFFKALRNVRPSVSDDDLTQHEKIAKSKQSTVS